MRRSEGRIGAGMRTSPWIILGATAILLVVVVVLAAQNTVRERRFMTELLGAKGAALIRAVEAGARTGMMGTMWGGREIQRLIEETARLPDVRYMAVVDPEGAAVAHSDPARIGLPFAGGRRIEHPGPDDRESWETVAAGDGRRVFEVHRHFRPLGPDPAAMRGHMQTMMRHHGMRRPPAQDWFTTANRRGLVIVVGLDPAPLEAAIRSDIRTTVVLSAVMLLLGLGGFVSLFWMHSYRAARKSLEDTSAFADEVVRHLPVGLIATDASGRVTFFNAAAERITGVERHRVRGRLPDGLLPEGLCGVREAVERGETVIEREVECGFTTERTVPLSVSAVRITSEDGKPIGKVIILRDLREIRRLEAEVRRQEKLAAMGGLAAGVAHEVRNPLSSIKALATFFEGQFAAGTEGREAAGVMVREVDRLDRVITELLEFSRPTDLDRRESDIGPLLARSTQLVQQDAANRKVDIRLRVEEGVCPAWIDPDRLTQCLLNLYLNAIQAMPGGGTLRVEAARVEDDDAARIVVSDTGPGIATAHFEKIFDPYFTTKEKGTGLGLAIVHKIVEAHRGRITVNRAAGGGAAFAITLPCRSESMEKDR